MLNTKFDLKWSNKRIESEHAKLTRRIDELELYEKSTDIISYSNSDNITLPNNSSFITNERDLFKEGKDMSHCVYSFWSKVKRKEYFVIKCLEPERCTVGITYQQLSHKAKLDQIYLKYDKNVKPETREIFENWLENDNIQEFFKNNYRDTALEPNYVYHYRDEIDFENAF